MATSASILAAVICLATGSIAQQLILTHAPSYVSVQQQSEPLSSSHVPNLISDTLGISQSQSSWSGLKSNSLFKRPKANVLLTVVTSKSSNENIKPKNLASFPVEADLPLLDMTGVMDNIQAAFLDKEPLMLDVMADTNLFDVNSPNDIFHRLPNSMRSLADRLLDPDSVLSRVQPGSLNKSHSADQGLMAELQMMDHVVNTLKESKALTSGKTPDLFSFVIKGLHSVSDSHGDDSQQARDAHQMVSQFIDQLTADFRQLYKDNVVVEVLTVPALEKRLVRKSRSLLATTAAPKPEGKTLNLAWDYHDDFPAMFNIVLWLTVLLAVTVFVISYGMWNIDPGRDSIIYRMTSQRLKKD